MESEVKANLFSSPLRGEGREALANVCELRRSWMGVSTHHSDRAIFCHKSHDAFAPWQISLRDTCESTKPKLKECFGREFAISNWMATGFDAKSRLGLTLSTLRASILDLLWNSMVGNMLKGAHKIMTPKEVLGWNLKVIPSFDFGIVMYSNVWKTFCRPFMGTYKSWTDHPHPAPTKISRCEIKSAHPSPLKGEGVNTLLLRIRVQKYHSGEALYA